MIGGRGKLHMCRMTLLGVIYLNFPSSSSRTEPKRDLEGDARSRLGEEAAQSRFDLGENAPARSRSRPWLSIKIAFGLGSGVPNRAEHRARSVHSQACSESRLVLHPLRIIHGLTNFVQTSWL